MLQCVLSYTVFLWKAHINVIARDKNTTKVSEPLVRCGCCLNFVTFIPKINYTYSFPSGQEKSKMINGFQLQMRSQNIQVDNLQQACGLFDGKDNLISTNSKSIYVYVEQNH
jgi:hypothetical protein